MISNVRTKNSNIEPVEPGVKCHYISDTYWWTVAATDKYHDYQKQNNICPVNYIVAQATA